MKLSRRAFNAVWNLLLKEAEQYQKNHAWISRMPKGSPKVAWRAHREHKARVEGLKVLLGQRSKFIRAAIRASGIKTTGVKA